MASLDSLYELIRLDIGELRNLCRDLLLVEHGSKLDLATRIKMYYDNYQVSTDTNSAIKQESLASTTLNPAIEQVQAEIKALEQKIHISKLEHEISVLYNTHMNKQSTPRTLINKGSTNLSRVIKAKSTEPLVTLRRRNQAQSHNDGSDGSAIPVASITSRSKYNQTIQDSPINVMQGLSGPSALEETNTQDTLLAYHFQASKLPRCEPPVFTGDILKYNDWNRAFTRFIDSNPTLTSGEKLSYLSRYTGGPVAKIVEQYASLDDNQSYATVRAIVGQRYGHPHKISQAYQRRLSEWPTIPSNNAEALQGFSDFLMNCHTAMNTIPGLSFLDHQHENTKLKQLLPTWLKRKWNAKAINYSNENSNQFPSFRVFVEFVHEHSEQLNHPIATDGELYVASPNIGQVSKKTHVVSHSASVADEEYECHNMASVTTALPKSQPMLTSPVKPPVESVAPYACKACKGNHKLYRCDKFKALSAVDKLAFVRKNNHCVNCLNESHGKKSCIFRLYCKLCNRSGTGHNQLLHAVLVDDKSETAEVTKNVTTSASLSCQVTKSSTSFVLPVYVSHKSNPDVEILTYAMIDSQSQITFVTDALARSLTSPDDSIELALSTMTTRNNVSNCDVYDNLVIRGYTESKKYDMKRSYGCSSIPNNLNVPTTYDLRSWPELNKIADQFPPVLSCDVSLLIGHDHHFFFYPIHTVPAQPPENTGEPFAIRTPLGWTMVGPVSEISRKAVHGRNSHHVVLSMEVPRFLRMKPDTEVKQVYQVIVKPTISHSDNADAVPMDVVRRLEAGFDMPGDTDHSLSSFDDGEFIKILSNNICQGKDGLYCMPLPFRGGNPPSFPDNRYQALSRLKSLDSKFKDSSLYEQYDKFMCDLILRGDAEPVPIYDINVQNKWYIPHHNVVNKRKPQKVRIVFDASCSYRKFSLNSHLLPGPDLNNSLVGVLTRFRERKVAVACDIERMFYRFSVASEHRDFLRFLWYDESHKVTDYRMTRHIFGATSSPGTAKFGMLQMAKDYGSNNDSARWFLENCFYVDDGLYSCSTVEEATKLLSDTKDICKSANLHLHKIMSNYSDVLTSFSESDLACGTRQISGEMSRTERVLGIDWNPVTDMFSFAHHCDESSVSRRNMLKSLASLFDPLGFLSPVILMGKVILQRSCHGFSWDEPLPGDLARQWSSWVLDLTQVGKILIPRCLSTRSNVKRVEIHTYADASETGYGVCCYLRSISDEDVSCSLLFGKSRVVPLKGCTIPRLELQAAVLAAKIGSQCAKELSISVDAQYYWSDSEVVLAYIQNTKKRLRQYVRNRVQTIHELTKVCDWNYVTSAENPADIASRGSTVHNLLSSLWFTGATVLSDPSVIMTELGPRDKYDVSYSDLEVQSDVVASHCVSGETGLGNLVGGIKSLPAAVKAVDILLHSKFTRWKSKYQASIQSLQSAEYHFIREVQSVYYPSELKSLTNKSVLKTSSPLARLDPFLDDAGLIRVGGRMKYADLLEKERHPVILPRKAHLTHLIIQHYHELCAHQGRGITTSYIRSAGYWIISLAAAVSNYIHSCIDCRKLRRPTETQKMADLPSARVNPSPPFSYVGVDCFGPFEVQDKRRLVKKYGIIFTCLYSRAVHVEVCDDMSSDSFINCLRAFIALRGHVRQIQCDKGTNFVGAANELAKALQTMTDGSLKQFLERSKCEFVFNSPASSHMGGVWERQIRTFRNILSGISLHSPRLDVNSIRIVFYECMNIMNSRPLTTVHPDSLDPLTPNHLIHMKSSLVLPPPPGEFNEEHYSRKRWRRVQSAIDLFWSRWRSSYLSSLQYRQRWLKVSSFSVGDIVLLKDENLCRGQWRMCRISELLPSHDGLVRRVKLRVGDFTAGLKSVQPSYLERPVHKLVLLIPNSEQ